MLVGAISLSGLSRKNVLELVMTDCDTNLFIITAINIIIINLLLLIMYYYYSIIIILLFKINTIAIPYSATIF